MKIYLPNTTNRIAQLHALGLEKTKDYDLTPLEALDKNHIGDPNKINKARKEEEKKKRVVKKTIYTSPSNRRAV